MKETSFVQKPVGKACPAGRGGGNGEGGSVKRGRPCRGKLVDFVLDWEHELPETDLSLSDSHSILSQLSIVIGSTLQIVPAGTMPTLTKKYHPGMVTNIPLSRTGLILTFLTARVS